MARLLPIANGTATSGVEDIRDGQELNVALRNDDGHPKPCSFGRELARLVRLARKAGNPALLAIAIGVSAGIDFEHLKMKT